jgi:uncharacterized protein YdiU (UPF0061 family)
MPSATFGTWDNSYARELGAFCVAWQPKPVAQPRLLHFNRMLAEELGWPTQPPTDGTDSERNWADYLSGNLVLPGAQPVAQAYAGHQFGGFSPQLGDGRALLLGEVIDQSGRRRDVAFKGSGPTPFSRRGDGKAAVGPMLRELLIGEAMHALGIPTTRALAVVATGEPVYREQVLSGAVLTRIASSHLRVGTFQYVAAHHGDDAVRQLADYAIERHDPDLSHAADRYWQFLRRVAQRQAQLVAQWLNVGFIHGVMNSDNMTISGETIDYGPCAFMEAYDPQAVFSSIDHQGRYAYGNQGPIAQWNLARLAETLLPLLHPDPQDALSLAQGALSDFALWHDQALLQGQRRKMGWLPMAAHEQVTSDERDRALVNDWLDMLASQQVDFTLAWRRLGEATLTPQPATLLGLFRDPAPVCDWLARWHDRLLQEPPSQRRTPQERCLQMQQANPQLIARNHLVEEALQAASDQADLAPLESLLQALADPWTSRPDHDRLVQGAPPEVAACYRTFCGT